MANRIKGDQAKLTGSHAAAAAGTAHGINLWDIVALLLQSPNSICFQVNSGFCLFWVRLNG